MQRILVVFAAVNTFLLLAIAIFVIHGSARNGCAEATSAASQAWQAFALWSADEAASELAATVAVGEVATAETLAEADLFASDPAARLAPRKLLRGKAGVLELARAATLRARAVCL